MGFFDDLIDIAGGFADIAKDIAALPGEIAKAGVELVNDITEDVAQSAGHTITGHSDQETRTSYSVKSEAETIITSSRNDYYNIVDRFRVCCDDLQRKETRTAKLREEIYEMLGRRLVQQPLAALPDPASIYFKYPSVPSIDNLSFDFGTSLGLFGASIRMEAAEEYLDKAKDYRDEINLRIAEVKSIIVSVGAVSKALTEETTLLENIQTAHAKASADKLLKTMDILYHIAEICVQEANDYTVTQYKKLLNKLNALWHSPN